MAQKKTNKQDIKGLYGEASKRYGKLETYRKQYEQTWRDASALTLPYIFPEETDNNTYLPTPYNSIGPKSVNSLASKLMLALLPPSGNFFRLLPFKEEMEKLSTEEKRDVDKELSQLERDITERISTQSIRVPIFEALKSLIVTGNTLLFKIPNGSFKIFSPYNYVVNRDYSGKILEIVIKENISKRNLPKKILEEIESEDIKSQSKNGVEDDLVIYTVIVRKDSKTFVSWQESNNVVLEDTIVEYEQEKLPYMALRWTAAPNENYGRGLTEQILGDLRSLEAITQLLVEGSSISAKTLFGLKPSSITQLEDINDSVNGDVIYGDLEKDITVLNVNKNYDFQIPYKIQQDLINSIGQAFLNFTNSVRDSERTTAVEVRATQAELETGLGGTYSVLSTEFQLPLLTLELNEINSKVLKIVTPSIITGVSAISRERDFQNINTMISTMSQFGDAGIAAMNLEGIFTSLATSLGLDPEMVVKSKEQIAMEQQQLQAQQAQQQGPRDLQQSQQNVEDLSNQDI